MGQATYKTYARVSNASRRAQSIVEVLIAIGIGVLFVGAAISLIMPSLQAGSQATSVQASSALAKGLLDNVRTWSEGNWNNILNLATGAGHRYYLNTTASPFVVSGGTEHLMLGTTTYSIGFSLQDVYRNSTGSIVTSGGSYDPSTKQITAYYSWPLAATRTMVMYLTRNENFVLIQNDWSGGPGQNGPMTSTNSQFATSSNIEYSTSTPMFCLAVPGC